MFGGSVTLTEDYGIWWSYITHFIHVPGYVYAYAFGDLLVRALYSRSFSGGGEFPVAVPGHAGGGRLRLALGDRGNPRAWTWQTRASGRRGSPCWNRWWRRRRTWPG